MPNQYGQTNFGEFGVGDDFNFLVREADFGFTPQFCDVWDSRTGTRVDSDLIMNDLAGSTIEADLRRLNTSVALTALNGYVEGVCYFVTIKSSTGLSLDANNWEIIGTFTIGRQVNIELDTQNIFRSEQADVTVTALPNSVMGRLRTLELNQIQNISPKLRRLLGLSGENQVLDGYFFDDASNITQVRLRVYDTAASARAAVRWADTENQSDPVGAYPTPGELSRQVIQTSQSQARQLRTELLGSLSTIDGGSGDAADAAYDDSSVI